MYDFEIIIPLVVTVRNPQLTYEACNPFLNIPLLIFLSGGSRHLSLFEKKYYAAPNSYVPNF